ncbi:unnamed protein product [Cunninghamella echinulata]
MTKKQLESVNEEDWLDSFVLSVWKPVVASLGIGIPIAYIFYTKVIGKRYPTVNYIPPELFDKKAFIRGKVTSIGDADGFRLYHTGTGWSFLRRVPTLRKDLKNQTIPIRIAGVDAPEGNHFSMKQQPFYVESKSFLTSLILNRHVKVQLLSRDQYSRVVGMVYFRKPPFFIRKNVSEEMLKQGFASIYVAKGAEYGDQLNKFEKAENKAK